MKPATFVTVLVGASTPTLYALGDGVGVEVTPGVVLSFRTDHEAAAWMQAAVAGLSSVHNNRPVAV